MIHNMQCNEFIPTREAKKILRVTEETLRRWTANGKIPHIRSPGGQRLYDIRKYINTTERGHECVEKIEKKDERQRICYCRVSSQGQKDDLQRQIKYMQEKFPTHRIIHDIGSGINFKRRGLRTILELASKGDVSEVVVAYRDRLCRFAFELIEWVLHTHGTKLVVLHESMDSSGQTELAEDLLAIINVFNCRVNGRRKYARKEDKKEGHSEESVCNKTEEGCSKCDEESEIESL